MSKLPLTIDLTNIITKVTGQTPRSIFNDKRKAFSRRYKFTNVHNVTPAKLKKIRNEIEKKYPKHQFVIQNSEYSSKKKAASFGRIGWYSGLKVLIF